MKDRTMTKRTSQKHLDKLMRQGANRCSRRVVARRWPEFVKRKGQVGMDDTKKQAIEKLIGTYRKMELLARFASPVLLEQVKFVGKDLEQLCNDDTATIEQVQRLDTALIVALRVGAMHERSNPGQTEIT